MTLFTGFIPRTSQTDIGWANGRSFGLYDGKPVGDALGAPMGA